MGSAVLSESPCCAGRQDLVLPQSALTHGSANTELHLKLWSCCPCCTFCQSSSANKRNKGGIFFSFSFFLPETFQPSVLILSLFIIFCWLRPPLPFSSLALSLPLLPRCIRSMKNLWQMFLPHSTFQGLTGSHMLVAQSLSPLCVIGDRGVQLVWVLEAAGQGNSGAAVIC